MLYHDRQPTAKDERTLRPFHVTEILFYHLKGQTPEQVLPALLQKSLDRGWRVVVQASSEERVEALDAHLWTWRDDFFCRTVPGVRRKPRSSRFC